MPIYDQSYRTFEGESPRQAQWATVAAQEWRANTRSRFLIYLFIVGGFHFVARVAQIIVFDLLVGDPNHPLSQVFGGVAFLKIEPKTFLQFVQIQTPLTFFAMLLIGSGMICNDFRNHLMEVYFSKPLTWRDYLAGKLMALVGVGLVLTAVPAVLLVLLHNLMDPAWETLSATWWLPLPIVAYSLLLLVVMAATVLAASAISRSANVAAMGLFTLVLTNSAMSALLPELLHSPNYALVALPVAIIHAGSFIFGLPAGDSIGVTPAIPLLYLSAVGALALWIAGRKVRHAEVEL
jgi:ABC-type transport system involved in multi-copper enzyme maturation permease subunit